MPQATQSATVTVTFSTNAPHFKFGDSAVLNANPEASVGGATYTVFWKLSGDSTPGSTILEPDFLQQPPSLPTGFTTKAPGSNEVAKGVFNHLGLGAIPGHFGYRAKVRHGAQTFTSTDPEVTLRPPG